MQVHNTEIAGKYVIRGTVTMTAEKRRYDFRRHYFVNGNEVTHDDSCDNTWFISYAQTNAIAFSIFEMDVEIKIAIPNLKTSRERAIAKAIEKTKFETNRDFDRELSRLQQML
jgi:hypothetical protein